jgi:hypothetical protein
MPCFPVAQVFPEKGTVSFSAGLHGWAFTLTVFADLYAKKFGVEVRPCQSAHSMLSLNHSTAGLMLPEPTHRSCAREQCA